MNKISSIVVLLVGVFSVSSFAQSNLVLSCAGDGRTKVTLLEVADNAYEANVTVEAAGGGLPTFKFLKITRLPSTGRAGAPTVYRGKGFDLQLRRLGRLVVTLSVPSLGVRNEKLICKN